MNQRKVFGPNFKKKKMKTIQNMITAKLLNFRMNNLTVKLKRDKAVRKTLRNSWMI